MEILGKKFGDRKEYLKFIVENENLIIESKKSAIKLADGFGGSVVLMNKKLPTTKGDVVKNDDKKSEILEKVAIKTTNVNDSHDDKHIKVEIY